MKRRIYAVVGLFCLWAPLSWAQEVAPQTEPPVTEEEVIETTETAAPPTAGPTDYETGDSWFTWQKMTGNWGGIRSTGADHGITFDLNVTQIIQGNAHGGADTTNAFRYSGTADLELVFDTGKMGLWPGGSITLHGEPKWGNGINEKVGSLIPVNLDAAKPGDDECQFTLSEYFLTQVLFEGKLILLAGKLDGSRAFETNRFANDERTQFLNTALRNNVMIPAFLPYSVMGVGAVVNPTPWLSILTAVTDSEGRIDTTGFETTFHGPTHTTVIHEWAFKVKPFDLPGTQRLGFAWSSKEVNHLQPRTPFKQTGPLLMKYAPFVLDLLAPMLPFEKSPDNVMLYYNFDQYVYTEADDPSQGIGVFGRFGWAREEINPVSTFWSLGVGGKGVIPTRDNDTCGIGWYYVDLSDDMPAMFHSEQGFECYYNIEVTPWLHISPDLQVIVNPGGTDANDVSLVYGMRMHMNL